MEHIILNDIKFNINVKNLLKKLHIDENTEDGEKLKTMAKDAQTIGRPKVLYKTSYIDSKGEDFVVIDGIKFSSRVLRINLEQLHRVFPYVATCGRELENWANSIDDMLENYWAITINEFALQSARKAFNVDIKNRYKVEKTSAMNPGSLENWPISQQRALFSLFENPADLIGVELTESFLMIPVKSVSGILFPTEVNFESCQLCQRLHCPNRRALYDDRLFLNKYAEK